MGEQELGVDARRRTARPLELDAGGLERLANGHATAGASSARRRSSAASASVELVEVALEHRVEAVHGQLDPVVGDPALREVVGADLLGALAAADLRPARRRQLLVAAAPLELEQSRTQDAQRLLLVLELRLLVLHRDDEAGRQVRDPHGGVGRVDALAAGAGRAVDVDLEVGRVDLDLDLLGLGHDGHGGGGGVDAALGLGRGDPLHAVRSPLPLEDRVGAVALDRERHLLVAPGLVRARAEHLGLEAPALGAAGQHPQDVARPERGLVAPDALADLDDHVLRVARVALDERELQLLLELGEAPLRVGQELGQLARRRGPPRRPPAASRHAWESR